MVELIVLGSVNFMLLGFIVWREVFNKKVVENLTDKLMARDFTEYRTMTQDFKIKKENKSEDGNKKPVLDPVLGKHF